jgi:hypothetical protein
MNDETERPLAQRVPLADPRPLAPHERALIDFLIAGPLGRPELRAQADMASVVAVCSCGCASVWMEVDGSAPSASYAERETLDGRTDYVALTAHQRETRSSEVRLHVVEGRIYELEVWGNREGLRPRIDISRLEHDKR